MRITAMKNVKVNNVLLNIELNWRKVSNAVKKATAKSIDELKKSRNIWYDDCKIDIERRRETSDEYTKNSTQMTNEVFIRERMICKCT